MTELDFVKRIAFRDYPLKIAVLVFNEIAQSFLILIGISGITGVLAGMLNGEVRLPPVLQVFLARLGVAEGDTLGLLLFLAVIYLFQLILEGFSKFLSSRISVTVTKDIREKMNRGLLKADWLRFSEIDQGKYAHALVTESVMAGGAVFHLGSVLGSLVLIFVLLIWLIVSDINTFLIFVLLGGVMLLSIQGLMRWSRRASEESIKISNRMHNVVNDTRQLFKVLLVENLVGVRIQQVEKLIARAATVDMRKQFSNIANSQILSFETILVLVVVFVVNEWVHPDGNANLLMNLLVLQRVGTYFSLFQQKRHLMLQLIPSFQTCHDLLTTFDDGEGFHAGEKRLSLPLQTVEIRDAEFRYPHEKGGVYDTGLELPGKGLVFFVGRSGSGKTTLVDIIMGLLPLARGTVTFNGQALDELDRVHFASLLAYVPQTAYLFEGSLRENLLLGSHGLTDDRIWDALDAVGFAAALRALPEGLDTRVASGGTNYSGGERQRLALARALLRGGSILVLDEPSASVDANSEQAIFQVLKELAKERLIIVVTHSEKVIQDQENIFLMDQGTCVWNGSYPDLAQSQYMQLIFELREDARPGELTQS